MSDRPTPRRCPRFAATIALTALFGASAPPELPAQSCGAPCLDLASVTGIIRIEDWFILRPTLALPPAADVLGWSFGICHDPSITRLVTAEPGPLVDELQIAGWIEFMDVEFDDAIGVSMQVIVCSAPCSPPVIPAGVVIEVLYEALDTGIVGFALCGTVEFPPASPVADEFTTGAGVEVLPSNPESIVILGHLPLLPPDPSYVLDFAPVDPGPSGSTRIAASRLTAATGAPGLAGWSFGICHDSAAVQVIGVEPGSALATLKNGQPVDFFASYFEADEGVVCGTIICMMTCATLPAGSPQEILRSHYSLVGSAGEIAPLRYCNEASPLESPIVETVVTASGLAIGATIVPGEIAIVDSGFIRGDAGGDGSVNIADAVYLGNFLFVGGPPPPCVDAADANDSGVLDISDIITVLSALFLPGTWMAQPYPVCGEDPTPDPLPCARACP